MLPERVRAELAATTRFRDVRHLEQTDSTNRLVAEEAAGGAGEGLVVTADVQTAGRGRLDRTWEAAPGAGLLVSILVRPRELGTERWHLVTAAAGLAAQQACLDVAGVEPELKWPNDLLVGGRKLAGILAEVPAAAPAAVVVGMGLNVHAGPPGSAHLDQAAGARVSRGRLLTAWLTALDGLLGRWDRVGDLYQQKCATVGRDVEIEQLDGIRLRGRAEAVDGRGRLLVRTGGGSVLEVSVGDVTHLRTPGR